MLSRTLLQIGLTILASVVAICHLVACDGGSEAAPSPQTLKVHAIKIIYPPEARTLVSQVVDRINAKNIPLNNSYVLRLSASSFDNFAALDKIGTPKMPAALWIAPFTPLAASVKRTPQSDVTIAECNSTMSTRLGVAYRNIDEFALPTQNGAVELTQLLLPKDASAGKAPAVVAGSPRFTSSGLVAALSAAAVATSQPLNALSGASVVKSPADIAKTQKLIRNYFTSDYDTLSWLNTREAGEPIAVLTTEQSYRSYLSYAPKSTLRWTATASPDFTLDYPLCSVITRSDAPLDSEAAKAVRLYFASDEFKSLLDGSGFSPPAMLGDINSAQLGAAASELISEWPKLRRPSMTIFVIDASIKTDRMTIETLRREIKLFIDNRPSPDDSVAIISASSVPDIISEPSTNAELLEIGLSRLSTSGGNAIRDGLQTAFSIFSDQRSRDFRRAVVVFTSGRDTSSQTSVTQISNRASQLVGRKNVDLFVIGLGQGDTDFGELPTLTQQVGGVFVRSSLASLPADLFPITRRVQ